MAHTHLPAARILRDDRGATLVEFALLAPVVIGFMIGVLQVGTMMQASNAVRSVTAETARYALVEYQKGNKPSNETIRTQAISIADGAPYLLNPQKLTVNVTDAADQRVIGVREITVSIAYAVPTTLPLFDFVAPTVRQTRPIFVTSDTATGGSGGTSGTSGFSEDETTTPVY